MIAPASYKVVIREILEKTVYVSAQSEEEALDVVEDAYRNEGIVLTSDNYNGNEIEVIGPSNEEPEF